jgi:hypothetical protein
MEVINIPKCFGLTEYIWTNLSEEKRLSWKIFSRGVAFLCAFFVAKTGNIYFDGLLGAINLTFLVIVIETQRTYSRLRPTYRKPQIRIAIGLGSWAVTVLGAAYFSQAALGATASVLSKEVLPAMNRGSNELIQIIILLAFLIALPAALFRVYRQLNLRELVYDLPRKGLKHLLVHKREKATSFAMFAYFELTALLVCLMYTSSVVEMANVFMRISRAIW